MRDQLLSTLCSYRLLSIRTGKVSGRRYRTVVIMVLSGREKFRSRPYRTSDDAALLLTLERSANSYSFVSQRVQSCARIVHGVFAADGQLREVQQSSDQRFIHSSDPG